MDVQTLKPGYEVTFGNAKTVWTVDKVHDWGRLDLNRQHGKPGRGHHLAFKHVRPDEFDKVFLFYPMPEPVEAVAEAMAMEKHGTYLNALDYLQFAAVVHAAWKEHRNG